MQKILFFLVAIFILFSCDKKRSKNIEKVKLKQLNFRFTEPATDTLYPMNKPFNVSAIIENSAAHIDSAILNFNSQKYICKDSIKFKLLINSISCGTKTLKIKCYMADGISTACSREITFKSDIAPQQMTYRIIARYNHDKQAYTQGLVYADNIFYESTGQWGLSSLRKVNPLTGEVLQIVRQDKEYFSEGIAVYNNKIVQLTYTNQIGFVYDKNSFSMIGKIYYKNREGWGLTYDGKHIIMSDGSHKLFYMNPETFSEEKVVEVFNNVGAEIRINEMEYINGFIYANIYTSDRIIKIEPNTGRVIAEINMSGLLKAKDKHPEIDVLNGIAWDSKTDRIFVTGKNWPKLFEVKFVKR